MSEKRILLTGDLPLAAPGKFDAADRLATIRGLPTEAVVHFRYGTRDSEAMRRLQSKREYVASVGLWLAPEVIELASPTELYVVDRARNLTIESRRHWAREVREVTELASSRDVEVRVLTGHEQLEDMLVIAEGYLTR